MVCFGACGGEMFRGSGSGGGAGTSSGGTGIGGKGSGGGGGKAGFGGVVGSGGSATGGYPPYNGGTGGALIRDASTDAPSAGGGFGTGGASGTGGGINTGGAIGMDATASCGLTVNAVSHTAAGGPLTMAVTHTLAGSNRLIIAALAIRHDTGMGASTVIPSPSSVSYAATALTQLRRKTDGFYQSAELWALVGPALGANQLKVTFSTAPQLVALGVVSFTGAAQLNTFGAVAEISGGGNSVALAVPSTGYSWVFDLLSQSGTAQWLPASAQQPLWEDGVINVKGYSSHTTAGVTTTDLSWQGMSANYVLFGVAIAQHPCGP